MISNIFIAVRSKIRATMNELADGISTGNCQDFQTYKQLVGRLEGLALAERHLLDVEAELKKHLDADDEA